MKKPILFTAVVFTALAFGLSPSSAGEKSVVDFFPDKLVDANGKKVSRDSLKGKTVGIYFSAHWCPPCRQFTPLLVKFRDKHKREFEVVFVSSDNSPEEKKEYMRSEKMKWPTIEGIQSKEATELAQKFQIDGIPSLIIIGPDGKPITPDGREHVTTDPGGALKLWQKAAKNSGN